jgi:hypothetical protein
MILHGGHPVVGFADGPVCPPNPAAPSGYSIWKGPVPPELTQWAIQLRDNIAPFPYGQQWVKTWNSQNIVARKDHHTWTYRKHPDGSTTLAQNICIPGITLYKPVPMMAGVSAELVFDPATAAPDIELALYPARRSGAPEPSFWGPALLGAAAGAGLVGALWWGRG